MSDTKSRIEELEKELYSKDFTPQKVNETLSPRPTTPTSPSWDNRAEESAKFAMDIIEKNVRGERRQKIMKKFFLISVFFFSVTALVAWFVWSGGRNIISSDNINIEISSPVAVAGGEQFETSFTVTNDNKVALSDVTLYVEYPTGFSDPLLGTALPRYTKKFGVIPAGDLVTEKKNVLVYGEENTQKEIAVVLEYRIAGSNAILKKESSYTIKISSSPLNATLNMVKEASAGQEIEMQINIESNSQNATAGVIVQATYPNNFVFKSADLAPSYGNNVWALGTIEEQGKRTIKVKGIIDGDEGEEKITKISIGTQNPKDDRQIGVVYNTVTETTIITESLFSIDVSLDGDRAPEHAVPFEKGVRADITWKSNSPTKITDAVIEVKLKGETLNRYSVYASSGGFYRSLDDTIVWEKTTTPELAVLDPGEQGTVGFSFSPRVAGVGAGNMLKNPQITLEVTARARRASVDAGSSEIITFATRKIKIETDISLLARGLYSTGPFKNFGPLPPRVEQETSYTIVWTVRNGSNNISNVAVKTTLPIYATWLANISPVGEDVKYDESNATITWNAGRIPAGGTREAAFQVSITPSLSQRNQLPVIVGESFLTAVDDFTKTNVGDRKSTITTNITADPQYRGNQGVVIE